MRFANRLAAGIVGRVSGSMSAMRSRAASAARGGIKGWDWKSMLVRLGPALKDAGRLGLYAAGRFYRDRCPQVAASLTYTTLLSMVPLMTIAFAILAAFPAFEGIREQAMSMVFDMVPQVGDTWTCNGFVPVTYLITPPWPRMRAG